MSVYNFKIPGPQRQKLEEKAKKRGMTLAKYLSSLLEFADTVDDYTNDESQVIVLKGKDDWKDKTVVIPHKKIKHG